ncbi:MAG: AraC family transcriptional regulator [Reichenbachiella sp.]
MFKVFYTITAFQTAFFCLFIYTTRVKKPYHNWLSALLFSLFVALSLTVSRWGYNLIEDSFPFRFLYFLCEYSIGPLFYIFIVKATQQKIQFKPKSILILTPFIIGLIFLFIPQYLWDQYWLEFHTLLAINFYGQAIIFFMLAYQRYKNYLIEIKNHVSQNYLLNVNTIRLLLLAFVLILFLALTNKLIQLHLEFKPSYVNPIIEMIILLSINIFLFIGLKFPVELTEVNLTDLNPLYPKKKYNKSTLSEERKTEISEHLRQANNVKYYQTPNLTIRHLSDKLGVHSKHLSQVINEVHNQNFCDYINTLRIEEAKSLLQDKKEARKTILEICYKVGFNSKTTFNDVFKKQTGYTPSEFSNLNH